MSPKLFLFSACCMLFFSLVAQDSYTDPASGVTFYKSEIIINHKKQKCVKASVNGLYSPGFSYTINSDCYVTLLGDKRIESLKDAIDYLKTNPRGRKSIGLVTAGYGSVYTVYQAAPGYQYVFINFPNAPGSVITPDGECLWGDCKYGRSSLVDKQGNRFIGQYTNGKLDDEYANIIAKNGEEYRASFSNGVLLRLETVRENEPKNPYMINDPYVTYFFRNGKLEKLRKKVDYYPKETLSLEQVLAYRPDELIAVCYNEADAAKVFTGQKQRITRVLLPCYNEYHSATITDVYENGSYKYSSHAKYSIGDYELFGRFSVDENGITGQVALNMGDKPVFYGHLVNDKMDGNCGVYTNPLFYNFPSAKVLFTAKDNLISGKVESYPLNDYDSKYRYDIEIPQSSTLDNVREMIRLKNQAISAPDLQRALEYVAKEQQFDATNVQNYLAKSLQQHQEISKSNGNTILHQGYLTNGEEGYNSITKGRFLNQAEALQLSVYYAYPTDLKVTRTGGVVCPNDHAGPDKLFGMVICDETHLSPDQKYYDFKIEIKGKQQQVYYVLELIRAKP